MCAITFTCVCRFACCHAAAAKKHKKEDRNGRVEVGGSKEAKHESGSKDASGSSMNGKKESYEGDNEKDITFVVIQKNVGSMKSTERVVELVGEAEGCKWDALLISEIWRPDKAEIWESKQGHIYMGAGKFQNRHGVGRLLNTKWR